MVDKQKITCRPIVVLDKEEKEETIGYCYYVETYHGEEQETIWWDLYSDGTYQERGDHYYPDECPEHWMAEGSFDKSKYNDFVGQMQSFKSDWSRELQPDGDKGWYSNV